MPAPFPAVNPAVAPQPRPDLHGHSEGAQRLRNLTFNLEG